MKRHAAHVATGGVVAPATLGLVTVIANAIQEAASLNLTGIALAIYLAAFLIGSALVVHGQFRLEAQRLVGELGAGGGLDLGAILGGLLGGGSTAPSTPPATSPPPIPPPSTPPPPLPPEPRP